jgi:uncharacterized protein YdeI (BOF family)
MFLFTKTRMTLVLMIASVFAMPIRLMAAMPTVVISEVGWAGSAISSSDEWLELTNLSSDAIEIGGWYLTGAGGESIVVPDESVIEPYSTFLITNYATPTESSALSTASNYTTTTLSLANGGFALYLYDNDGSQIDSAGDGGAPFAGRSGGTKDSDDGLYRSMLRVDVMQSGSEETAWMSAETASGFIDGATEFGTPGSVESWYTPMEPVEEDPEPTFDDLTIYPNGTLFINEFVSNPAEEGTEWIEIVNLGSDAVDTTGWSVEDSIEGSTLLETAELATGEYLVIKAPKGKLNNDGDSILLIDPDGNVVDMITYATEELSAPKDGEAAARDESGVFVATTAPTPGEMNVISNEVQETTVEIEEEVQVENTPTNNSNESEANTNETSETDESSVTNESSESNEPAPVFSSGDMLINEFVSDPIDQQDEWVEIVNRSNDTINTTAWTVEDATGRATELEETMLAPDEYLLVEKPRGKLNNSGDTIILKDPSGSVIDSVTYGTEKLAAPMDGKAAARNGETFEVTLVSTPMSPNLFVEALMTEMNVEEVEADVVEDLAEEDDEYVTSLAFSELYPNTIGSDLEEESIALTNTGLDSLSLMGWMIEDGSTDTYMFDTDITLNPGETFTLMRTVSKIALNNTGDTLQLFAPDGALIDQITYGAAAKGSHYLLTDQGWNWTHLGESVVVETVEKLASGSTSAASNTEYQSTSMNVLYTVESVKALRDGTEVIIIGTVTVSPGVFGKQTLYVQDQTGGIQIYKYDGDFGEIQEGDAVQIRGELSSAASERRVKITADGSIVVTGTDEAMPAIVSTARVNDSLLGSLIQTSGRVLSRSSSKITLEDEGAQVVVYLKTTPQLDSEQFTRGSEVKVTGVLTSSNGELRVRPRSQEDIEINDGEVAGGLTQIDGAMGQSNGTNAISLQERTGWILLIFTTLTLGLLAIRKYLPAHRRQSAA